MGDETPKAWVLDRRIDLGSILPLIALFFGVLAWGVRLESKVLAAEQNLQRVEQDVKKDRDNTREDLKEINQKMDRILQQLLSLKK